MRSQLIWDLLHKLLQNDKNEALSYTHMNCVPAMDN